MLHAPGLLNMRVGIIGDLYNLEKKTLLQLTQLQQGRAFMQESRAGNQSAGQIAKQRAGKPTPSFSLGKAHTIREPTAGT